MHEMRAARGRAGINCPKTRYRWGDHPVAGHFMEVPMRALILLVLLAIAVPLTVIVADASSSSGSGVGRFGCSDCE
jgi:hypothetical protein